MIFIPYNLKTKILDHLEKSYPLEGCGLLIGQNKSFGAEVTDIAPSKNIATNPNTNFEIDTKMHLKLQKHLRFNGNGSGVIGVYHSHPDGEPAPSFTDHIRAIEPSFIWLISNVTQDRSQNLHAYRFNNQHEGFKKLDLVLTKESSQYVSTLRNGK